MNNIRLTFLPILFLLVSSGCGGSVSLVGTYHIEQDGYGFGHGASEIKLNLKADKSFDVKAGPITMLAGTWETKGNELTFSKGEGSIVVSYRAEGSKLVPQKDGKDVTGWRWKRE